MKNNPAQMELPFGSTGLVISNSFVCEHNFYTESLTCHEVCEKCGLVVPHEYILDNCDLKDWPDE